MSDLPRLLALGRHRGAALGLSVGAGLLTVASGVGLLATSTYLISAAALRPPVLSLLTAIVCVRAFAIARAALRYADRMVSHDAGLRLLADVRVWAYERIEPLLPAGLDSHRTGDLLARLVADVDRLQDLFLRGLAPPLVAALVSALVVAAAWALLPAAAAGLAIGLVLGGLALPLLAHRLARGAGRRLTAERARLTGELVEVLEGAPDLIAFGAHRERLALAQEHGRRLEGLERRAASAAGLGSGLALLVAGLTMVGTLAVAVPAVGAGLLPGVLLGALAFAPLAAFEGLAPLPAAFAEMSASVESGRRVLAVADLPAPAREPAAPLPPPTEAPGRLELRGARLRYGPGQPWALDGVDLTLEPRSRVAVVGPSGAGKSTLLAVLVRFRDLDGGTARLCGHHLGDYRSDDVRRAIGLVPQEVHLFNTSVLENVRLGRPAASEPEIAEAARRAGILEWARSLPAGWHTPVGERGGRVSGGQRQRIALARAFLADFPILLLDEPAAQLELELAEELVDDLLAGGREASLLLVTHRLLGMERMDEIVVMDRGRVVERGTHAELAGRGGLYRTMWDRRR